ncbi:hypothetical protein [Paracoccus aminophilus]|uniref:Uncharacterized protein n=1 Tax=Paracoccus aminophilus JCM 7686 TaxID=1367847 RepID=S5YGZ1_PARAH|nr:hypothetical protein [Paracoccus aminophilus]AGT10738.1 hypothetical protein JCM7686_pAMI4p047 [Paracoccus aminophilus JCM 7686]
MRSLVLTSVLSSALCLAALPALSQEAAKPLISLPVTAVEASPISHEIAEKGIGPVLARLHGLANPTPDEKFATAGLELLAAVQSTYQWRVKYQVGTEWGVILGMQGQLPDEAAPREPFPPAALADQTEVVLAAMARLQEALKGVAEGPDFGVTLDLSDLWFDLDGDGKRADWENAGTILNGVLFTNNNWDENGNLVPLDALPVIRFDNADAAWLSAYGHLIAGSGEMLLAFHPTESLSKILETRKQIDAARQEHPDAREDAGLDMLDPMLEPLATAFDMLHRQPDPERTRRAKAHWLDTIAQNRLFWKLVDAETDNAGEWIPNDRQVSATGFVFPQGTGAAWLSVLDDGEALLNGKKSVPFWRAPIGLDLGKWLDHPKPLPIDGVVQGWAIADYFTKAPQVSQEAMGRFSELFMDSDPFLAMVMIN